MPITVLSYTRVFESLTTPSPETYTTGLVAASNKTVAGIAREVLPASGKRTLNKLLTEYEWDEQQFNYERLEEMDGTTNTEWRVTATPLTRRSLKRHDILDTITRNASVSRPATDSPN